MKKLLTAAVLLLLLTGCGRDRTYPRFSNAGAQPAADGAPLPLHAAEPVEEPETGLPPQHYRAQQLQLLNPNAVGWLYVPDTGIDEVIMYHPSDNGHYVRRGFDELYSYYGMMFADYRCTFGSGTRGELARNTTIYGGRYPEREGARQLTPLTRYLDPAFAAEHPYLYFSTTEEDMAWEVFAVFYAHVDIPFNRWDISDAEFARMLELVTEASVYEWDGIIGEGDRILTLCTNLTDQEGGGLTGEFGYYRFAVMARLAPPGGATKTVAALSPRPGPTAVAVPDWIREGAYDYHLEVGD